MALFQLLNASAGYCEKGDPLKNFVQNNPDGIGHYYMLKNLMMRISLVRFNAMHNKI